ncbi:MAG: zinc ribbon domain-containing protein [Bacteroidaceae bacterium]|nr:zinc ribbon domain-containing protein [Bacteroidaceae bacterium]
MLLHRLFLLLLPFMACACTHRDYQAADRWDLPQEQRDSLEFALTRHFTVNDNFVVSSDSVELQPFLPQDGMQAVAVRQEAAWVYRGDKVVVAQTVKLDTDGHPTFYIKVAHNQEVMGWITEDVLLENAVPCDPISQAIHAFSNNYLFALFILMGMVALLYLYRLRQHKRLPIVHFNDIDSLYPTLLCMTVAVGATLYTSIRQLAPDMWAAYYFAPSLNPFVQPWPIGMFLLCAWLTLILFIASLDDIRQQLHGYDVLTYTLGLASMGLVLYLIFSQATKIYVGYPLLGIYIGAALHRYRRQHVAKYLCGNCGKPLHRIGRCPHCGMLNREHPEP